MSQHHISELARPDVNVWRVSHRCHPVISGVLDRAHISRTEIRGNATNDAHRVHGP